MTDAAKALRAKLCIESECTFDDGCGCLDAIRAALAAAQAGASDEIERLQAEIERMLKALYEAGDEILRQRKAGAEWQEKYKAGVSLSSNEGLENWQRGFAAGIEAAASTEGVRRGLAARIRALRPAETATVTPAVQAVLARPWPSPRDDAVTYDPMGAVMTSEYPMPQPAGTDADYDLVEACVEDIAENWPGGWNQKTFDAAKKAVRVIIGRVRAEPTGLSEEDVARMAEAIQKSIERGCDITPPESLVAARAAYMALRAEEPTGPSEEDVARVLCETWPKNPNGCAALCMDRLGDIPKKGCRHRLAVHGKRAQALLALYAQSGKK